MVATTEKTKKKFLPDIQLKKTYANTNQENLTKKIKE